MVKELISWFTGANAYIIIFIIITLICAINFTAHTQ